MRLRITTPADVIVEADDVRHVRAEDETGAFGILAGHADFITVLQISVVTWRDEAHAEHFAAVRGGILTVRDGERVDIATRDAVDETTLHRLGRSVLRRFQQEAAEEGAARLGATSLQLKTMRQLQRYLVAGRGGATPRTVADGTGAEART